MGGRGRDDAAARDVLYSGGQKEERSEVNLHGDGRMMIMNMMMMMSCKVPAAAMETLSLLSPRSLSLTLLWRCSSTPPDNITLTSRGSANPSMPQARVLNSKSCPCAFSRSPSTRRSWCVLAPHLWPGVGCEGGYQPANLQSQIIQRTLSPA